MSTPDQEQDRWEPCPQGTLVHTAGRIRARKRDRRRAKFVGTGGGIIAVLFVATMIAQQFGSPDSTAPNVGQITCAKVQSLLPAYIAGKLEAAMTGQVEKHLGGCPHCRHRYEKAKDETALPGDWLNESPQLAIR